MTKRKRPPLSDIIAKTPGANTRAQAKAFLKMRRAEITAQPPLPPERALQTLEREPAHVIDDADKYGTEFWQRFIDKQNAGKPAGKSPSKKPSRKKPGRPTKRPSPFTVIDGDDKK
jgi:hypothetical protein